MATAEFFKFNVRLWGLVTAVGAFAGATTLIGFFGSLNWLMDLCSHFRVQYFMGLSVVALLLLIPRKRRSATIFGVLAVLNLGVILPLYFGKASTPPSDVTPIRAMLINVNTKLGKPADVANAIRQFNPDVVVLEEINDKWLVDLKPVFADYRHSEQEPRGDNFGIALFSKFPFTHSEVAYIGDAEVPSVMAEIATTQAKCTVLATHPLPPGSREYSELRNRQLAELPRWVQRANSPVLLLGDLNVTPWNHYFKRLVRESGLRDSSQGRGVHPTWPTFIPLLLIPIDHCLYSPGIAIANKQTGPQVGSDHFPVIVDFVIETDGSKKAN
jgi:endonuclease/exonuclease/phosphatase (EEP) superfamily protein YafD